MTTLEERLINEILAEPWYQEKYRKQIARILARLYFMGKKDGMDETDWERKKLKYTRNLAEMFIKMLDGDKPK